MGYSQLFRTYWIVPSIFLVEHSPMTKTGKYAGHYTVNLATAGADDAPIPNPTFAPYREAFGLPAD